MAAPTPTKDSIKVINIIGMNDSMIEYTKMTILLAFHDYPQNDYDKAVFIKNKFGEKYGGFWSCVIYKNANIASRYFNFYVRINYKDYGISIWKSSM